MEGNEHEWTIEDVGQILIDISRIDKDFWEDGERHVLPNKQASEDIKNDLLAILEVTNSVYEKKPTLATEQFIQLTKEQKILLFTLIGMANGQICSCPDCAAERNGGGVVEIPPPPVEIQQKERERIQERMDRHLRLEEVSRNKTYEVSEDVFVDLMSSKEKCTFFLTKLETVSEFLDNDDPRVDFCDDLLRSYYDTFG